MTSSGHKIVLSGARCHKRHGSQLHESDCGRSDWPRCATSSVVPRGFSFRQPFVPRRTGLSSLQSHEQCRILTADFGTVLQATIMPSPMRAASILPRSFLRKVVSRNRRRKRKRKLRLRMLNLTLSRTLSLILSLTLRLRSRNEVCDEIYVNGILLRRYLSER